MAGAFYRRRFNLVFERGQKGTGRFNTIACVELPWMKFIGGASLGATRVEMAQNGEGGRVHLVGVSHGFSTPKLHPHIA